MPFDPSAPFEVAEEPKSGFDPGAEFEIVSEPETVSQRPSVPEPGRPDLLGPGVPSPFGLAQTPTMGEQVKAIPEMTPEQAKEAAIGLFTQSPVETPIIGEPGTITRGASEFTRGAVNFATSPIGLGLSAVPGPAWKVLGPVLGAPLVREGSKKIGEAYETGDRQKMTEGVLETAMGAAGFLHPTATTIKEARTARTDLARMIDRLRTTEAPALPVQRAPLLPFTAKAVEDFGIKPKEAEVPSATEKGTQQESVQSERERADAQRLSTETSPGDSVLPAKEQRPELPPQPSEQQPKSQSEEAPLRNVTTGWDKSGEIQQNPNGYFEHIEDGEVVSTDKNFDSLMRTWSEANAGYSQRIVEKSLGKFELFLKDPGESDSVHELIPYDANAKPKLALPEPPSQEAPLGDVAPEDITKAVFEAMSEHVAGIKRNGDKSGHYIVIPPEAGIEGDTIQSIGPFESKQAADEFLDSEVGAPGARVIEVDKEGKPISQLPESKPLPPSTTEAPQVAAPKEASVSSAESEGVTAPSEPQALPENKPKPPIEPTEAKPVAAEKKIKRQVKSAVTEEGPRAATEIKSELVERLERAIDVAPSEGDVKPRSSTQVHGKTTVTPDSATKITIDIPGDGSFTIRNTKEALSEILKRAKRISTNTKPTTTISKAAVQSSEGALRQVEKAKELELQRKTKVNQENARKSLYDAINKGDAEGIVGRSQPMEDPETYPDGTMWKEWRIRKATPEERSEAWKRGGSEIRWVGERRTVKFSKEKGRTENPWLFDDSGKTRADVIRGMDANMPRDAIMQDQGARLWRDLENMTGSYAFLKSGEAERAPATESESGSGMAGAHAGVPLTPLPPVPTKTPKGQRQIITDLAKGLRLPIRFGRLRTNRFAGYFMKVQNLIGSKKANSLPIVTHEVGHKLDAEFDISSNPGIRPELDMLGDPSTPGSMSSWTKSKTRKYKMGEGVAEFVRYWLTDPAHARTVAPNTNAYFERVLAANKDFGDVMRQAQEDIQLWRSAAPQARLRSNISVGENPNGTRYTFSQLTRDFVDDLHFLRMATDDAAKGSGRRLPASQDVYLQARLLRGSYGMADTFIRRGTVDFRTKAVDLGKSLQSALEPVAGRIDDFRDWIVAKRAQELRGRGKETGLLPADVDFVANKFNGDKAFQDAFTKVKDWQASLLKYAEDAGLLTAEGRKSIEDMNLDYVPFHRVFEIGAGEKPSVEGTGTGRGLNVGKPSSLKGLKGSPRDIVDPLESMIRNAYAIITASEKAHIHRVLADYANKPDMGRWIEHIATPKERVQVGVEKIREQLEAVGADLSKVPDDLLLSFFQNSKTAPFGENIIRVVKDGKPEFYRLNSDLFDTFHALDLEDSGQLIRLMSQPAQWLRSGVVLAPDFALANAMRDTFSAAVISKYNTVPFEVTLRGMAAMIGNPKLVAEWAAAGGKNSVEAAYFDRTKMQNFLKEHITKDLTPAERALIVVKSPLVALRWLTEKAEEATRVGEYQVALKDLMKRGVPEGDARRMAAFESRDRQDFAKGGAKTKIIRRITPFWNAALQANVRLAQSFKERPFQTALKGLAFITLPKLLEQAVNYDNDDYWDRPQWERDLFFMIPFDKDENGHTRFIRIPTPFEPGVIFGTLPGRVVQWAKQSGRSDVQSYLQTLFKGAVPNPMPPFANVIFENFLSGKQGWDIFRGRPIVPESLKELPPELQWTEQTSLTARHLGKMLGVSPLKIDHIVSSTTGGIGQQLTHNVADRAISAVTGEKATAQGKLPGGRFVTTPAGVTSQAIETFYDNLGKITAEESRNKLTGESADYAGLAKDFRRAAQQIGKLRHEARNTSDLKERQLILLEMAEIAKEMNRVAAENGLK